MWKALERKKVDQQKNDENKVENKNKSQETSITDNSKIIRASSSSSINDGPKPDLQRGIRGRRSSTSRGGLPPMPTYSEPVTFKYEINNHTSRMQRITRAFQVYRLTVLTLICIIAGIIFGLLCRHFSDDDTWTERRFMYLEFPGELYVRLLKLIIVPLLVSNVILSFGTIQGKLSSHLGKIASMLYLVSNLLSIIVALAVVLIICPGKHKISDDQVRASDHINTFDNQIANRTNLIPLDPASKHYIDRSSSYQTNKKLPINGSSFNQKIESIVEIIQRHKNHTHTNSSYHKVPDEYNKTNQLLQDHHVQILPSKPELLRLPITSESGQEFHHKKVGRNSQIHNQSATDRSIPKLATGTNIPFDIVLDILRNLVPDNLVATALQQTKTRLLTPNNLSIGINGTSEPAPWRWQIKHEKVEQANIIGLLAISVLTGVVLSHMGEAGQPLLDFCACISELSLRIGIMTINLTPFCIMFLLIGQVVRTRDLSSVMGELFMYLATVFGALLVHGFILMPALYWIITRKSPIDFVRHLVDVLVASFATSSSSASLALLVSSLIQYDLNPIVVRAFGPLGSVFNMNGTTIYEIVACIFLAQKMNFDLTLSTILLVGLASAVAGLSTVGLPSSGMMTIVIVLDAINLPAPPLSLIYIVDFMVDRFRTVINVWTGAITCALIDHLCPERLFLDEANEHRRFLKMLNLGTSQNGPNRSSLINNKRLSESNKSALQHDEAKKYSVTSISNSANMNSRGSQVISVTITPPPQEQPGNDSNVTIK